ncbi:hypothetical protein [Metallibacterium sp.]|uniref:hypothetical protein n=1 Tax=Metallibacterium sp. TaxID=2940281 RepID=UPI00261BA4A0|nr:hypothetical protein [Metallibacterium sp.]
MKRTLAAREKTQREAGDRALLALIDQAGIRVEVEALAHAKLNGRPAALAVQS